MRTSAVYAHVAVQHIESKLARIEALGSPLAVPWPLIESRENNPAGSEQAAMLQDRATSINFFEN
jgi:hypothetical protein